MPCTANDLFAPNGPGGGWDMTVLELAFFMSVFRARRSLDVAGLARVVSSWFDQPIAPEMAAGPIANMVVCRLLAIEGDSLRATGEGRAAARPLMAGIIRMIDHGPRLVDVALMLPCCGSARGNSTMRRTAAEAGASRGCLAAHIGRPTAGPAREFSSARHRPTSLPLAVRLTNVRPIRPPSFHFASCTATPIEEVRP